MNRKNYFSSAIALALLCSCGTDYSGPDYEGSKALVYATIGEVTTATRASGTSWGENDAIGVTISGSTVADETTVTNIKYVTDGTGTFTASESGSDIYILGATTQNFIAYYLYSGSNGVLPSSIEFDASGEQTAATQAGYDFLWSSTTATRENPTVSFTFTHMMSRIDFEFVNNSSTEITGDIIYSLSNLYMDGSFNPETGTVTAGTTTTATASITAGYSETATILLPPQTTSGIELVIYAGGKYYEATLDITAVASTKTTYTVSLDDTDESTKITVTSNGITDWTTVDGGDLSIEERIPDVNSTVTPGDWNKNEGTINFE